MVASNFKLLSEFWSYQVLGQYKYHREETNGITAFVAAIYVDADHLEVVPSLCRSRQLQITLNTIISLCFEIKVSNTSNQDT